MHKEHNFDINKLVLITLYTIKFLYNKKQILKELSYIYVTVIIYLLYGII